MSEVIAVKSRRDRRVDVVRGMALLMILIDHIDRNVLAKFTVGKYGFCDAAEVFVLLAGFASMYAYGKGFRTDGFLGGIIRICKRIARIYLVHVGLLLSIVAITYLWLCFADVVAQDYRTLVEQGWTTVLKCLTLFWQPSYMDILPLYIVLLACFPLIYFGILRLGVIVTLSISGAIWLVFSQIAHVNLPNMLYGTGWFFNPFGWQFLFALGAGLAVWMQKQQGDLPRFTWLCTICWLMLAVGLIDAAPWTTWGLPRMSEFMVPTDKTSLDPLRLLNVLALAYLLFTSKGLKRLTELKVVAPIESCGKNSLEVFAMTIVLSLLGTLMFSTFGDGLLLQAVVNLTAIITLLATGMCIDRLRRDPRAQQKMHAG